MIWISRFECKMFKGERNLSVKLFVKPVDFVRHIQVDHFCVAAHYDAPKFSLIFSSSSSSLAFLPHFPSFPFMKLFFLLSISELFLNQCIVFFLTSGYSATMLRDVPFSMIYFALYARCKQEIFDRTGKLGVPQYLICGMISGAS